MVHIRITIKVERQRVSCELEIHYCHFDIANSARGLEGNLESVYGVIGMVTKSDDQASQGSSR